MKGNSHSLLFPVSFQQKLYLDLLVLLPLKNFSTDFFPPNSIPVFILSSYRALRARVFHRVGRSCLAIVASVFHRVGRSCLAIVARVSHIIGRRCRASGVHVSHLNGCSYTATGARVSHRVGCLCRASTCFSPKWVFIHCNWSTCFSQSWMFMPKVSVLKLALQFYATILFNSFSNGFMADRFNVLVRE